MVTRADLDKQPAEVQAMFDDVARRYDLTNDILSMGQDRRWRRLVLDAVAPRPGERVLDLAAGTGTSSQPFRDRGAYVVPVVFGSGKRFFGSVEGRHLLGDPDIVVQGDRVLHLRYPLGPPAA